MKREIVVVGGGPAGMMAALTAARAGEYVTLIERNERLGRKLYITGKGRCNLTNHCDAETVLRQATRNGKFLYSSVRAFPPVAVMEFFEGLGVPLKTERGNRVFPASDRAADVIDALTAALKRAGVRQVCDRVVEVLIQHGAVSGLRGETGEYSANRVILATGGASYPLTGSTGDGYSFASALGHTVLPARPSLVPLVAEEGDCGALQGLSLRNVTLSVCPAGGKPIFQEQGELLFTHFGLSGPLALSASAHMKELGQRPYEAMIDLKPALDFDRLEARLLRDFQEFSNLNTENYLPKLVPRLMAPVLGRRAGLAGGDKLHSVSREGRRRLLNSVKRFTITILGTRPIAEAIITSGGVNTDEIDPKTMASKRVHGLFFAGELIDVDAYTGGFNLQIAWATGRAAGLSAGKERAG